jgi:mevalonate kinase
MEPLQEIPGSIARKYSGGGYGGYALHLFANAADRAAAIATTENLREIEPFCRL